MLIKNQEIPAIGALAPDFTLGSTSMEQVALSSFRGKNAVLVAFFPLAFTSTCTTELCEFSDDYSEFT
ncbi:MAG TPA: redoxin domain-containing protein, partial [Gemmatimonadaceae bacterium]